MLMSSRASRRATMIDAAMTSIVTKRPEFCAPLARMQWLVSFRPCVQGRNLKARINDETSLPTVAVIWPTMTPQPFDVAPFYVGIQISSVGAMTPAVA